MTDARDWLNREVDRIRGERPIGPARYSRAEFREVRPARGQPRTGRFVNLRTGENVPRRQMQKLIGMPLPRFTKRGALERLADKLESGIEVRSFVAQIADQGSGGRRGRMQAPRSRHREMREPVDVQDTEGVTEALREGDLRGAAEELQYATLRTWWNGGEADIEGVEDFEAAI